MQRRFAAKQLLILGRVPSVSDSESHALPSEIAGYRIIKMLGEGGMSVVYAAMQSQPKRMVALKVLKGTSFPPSVRRRFKQEVEILGKLRHRGSRRSTTPAPGTTAVA